MKFEAATIKDISKALGLSTSTVSRALRDSHQISDITKKKVLSYAKKINYIPNPIALSLKERRSRTIGIIVPEIANSFFSQAINGIESVANEKNYNVLISQSQENLVKEDLAINFMCNRGVDGIIISVSSETKDNALIKQYNERGMPVVCFDRVLDGLKTHKIVLANYKAGYDATYHLIKNGYKKIAFLGGAFHNSITKERIAGYKDALAKYNIPYDENYVSFCNHGGLIYDEVVDAMNSLMKTKNKPTAIFAASDKLTTNCLRYCNLNYIAIPRQLAVIGFSNLDLTDLLFTPLSVVKQPAFEMGRLAAEHLINTIESKKPVTQFEHIVLPVEIFVRDSTKKV
jgi:DNA-binding LacI/PurR family transcriptional regulator